MFGRHFYRVAVIVVMIMIMVMIVMVFVFKAWYFNQLLFPLFQAGA